MIPFVKPVIPEWDDLKDNFLKTLYGGSINEGQQVYNFENALASYLKIKNVNCVSSGSAALHISLVMSGVQQGDLVISTSLTAEPTNTVIKSTGADIYYCDLDPKTGQLDLNSLNKTILEKAKAFVVVHYGGYVQSLCELEILSRKYNFKLIEDCAHAIGSQIQNKLCGTIGDFGCFSFQAIKQITTIEGGAITYKDGSIERDVKELRWFGLSKDLARSENNITRQGFKYNYNNVHATIGLASLETYGHRLSRVRGIAKKFDEKVTTSRTLEALPLVNGSQSSYWLYLVKTDYSSKVKRIFNEQGVAGGEVHKLNHLHSYLSTGQDLPGAKEFYSKLFHIPIGPWLTDIEVEKILKVIENV